MKISVISILLLLDLSLSSQELIADNRKVVEYCYQNMSSWYFGHNCYGYFSSKKNEGELFICVKTINEPILSPYLFIRCKVGNIALRIDKVKRNGFLVAKIGYYDIEKIKIINTGIISINVISANKRILMMFIDSTLNNQVKQIINYTKPL